MESNSSNRFVGKVALVVGGSYGIGYAVVERLASEGAKVVFCSRRAENVKKAEENLRRRGYTVKGVVCHVSDREQRKQLIDAAGNLGGLDILFVNAGVNPSHEGIFDCTESKWDKIHDVNLKSPYLLSQEVLPLLKQSKSGRIIYNSTIGTFQTREEFGAYAVSKTGLLSLTKMAAVQLAKFNITVNCVVPGLIDTSFSKLIVAQKDHEQDVRRTIPLNRAGKPEEVAALVAFLASEEAGYITGENIFITGGINSRL